MLNIGDKIRNVRRHKGLSQEYVAEYLNISQVALSSIENNKSKLSVNRLEQLSNLFQMNINDVLTYGEPKSLENKTNDNEDFFMMLQQRINESFEKERNSYQELILQLKEENNFLRKQLKK